MENVEYVYTLGMSDADIDRFLREQGHGVLALAAGDESYAVPINYVYEDGRVLLRVSETPDSDKVTFANETETATLVVYASDDSGSWSILVRGPVRRLPDAEQSQFTDRAINDRFSPFRLFGEDVDEVEMAIYELDAREITGRRTADRKEP